MMKFDDWVAKVKTLVGDDLPDCSQELLLELYRSGMYPVSGFAYIRNCRQWPVR
jgi:hypothetical protein